MVTSDCVNHLTHNNEVESQKRQGKERSFSGSIQMIIKKHPIQIKNYKERMHVAI